MSPRLFSNGCAAPVRAVFAPEHARGRCKRPTLGPYTRALPPDLLSAPMFGRMIPGVKTVLVVLATLLALAAAPGAWGQGTATLGTNPPGSVFYAVASGLTKV